jgi:hypothetical protein
MSNIKIRLRYMPHPHDGWEAYMTKDDERWGGNSMTYGDPLKAMTLLAQNLAETLDRELAP